MIYDGIRVYCGDIRWYTVCTLVIYDGIRLYCDGIRLVYDWYTIGIRLVYDWYTIGIRLVYDWYTIGIRLLYIWIMVCNMAIINLETTQNSFWRTIWIYFCIGLSIKKLTIKWKTCLSKHFSYHFQLLDCPKCAPQPDCISFPKTKHFIS